VTKGARYFDADALRFLTELRTHNRRDWFLANKGRYEQQLRDPMLRFITALGPKLAKVSPHFTCDARPVGGSMMRIYRDIRFAKDKSPYKTHLAAHFMHRKGKAGTAPAFYLHIEPGKSMVGAGIWQPDAASLKRIRDRIVSDTRSWQRATSGGEFRAACGMMGAQLKRPPAGYDPAHPFIEDLKRKDFATSTAINDRDVTSPRFMDAVLAAFRTSAPFVSFLSQAVRVPF
jgi:uncharacterized protein (TIGR02453 family)